MNTPPAPPPPPSSGSRPPEPRGFGCLIAAGLIAGPVVGLAFGQVSAGLVAGGVLGVLAAIALAMRSS